MEEVIKLTTLESIKAFSDPYRLQIISTFRKFKRPATVKEISDMMGETPAKVHYHVKKLEKAHILVLVSTKEINGIIAKYYEPTAERYVIKHDHNDRELAKVLSGETQRVVSNLYDLSRQMVLDAMEKAQTVSTDQKKPDFVRSVEIYLNDDEAKDLSQLLRRFAARKTEEEQKDRQKYHLFAVLHPINDEVDTK